MIFSLSSNTLASDLQQAGITITPNEYKNTSLAVSIVLSLFLSSLYFLSTNETATALAILLASLAAFLYASISLPKILKQSRAEKIEAELPVVLRAIAAETSMRIPFEKTLEHVATSKYVSSSEFKSICNEISKGGASVQEALAHAASRIDSITFKRATAQMIFAYETGSKGEPLKKLADELMQTQKAKTREFSAKMSVLGLLFITLSCLIPALFQIYATIGSTFLEMNLKASDAWLAYLVVFPAANLLLLAIIQLKTPPALQTRHAPSFLSKKEKQQFNQALKETGINASFTSVMAISIALAITSFISTQIIYSTQFSAAFLFLPIIIYLLLQYKVEQRNAELERFLPDALFQASSLQKGIGIEKTIQSIAKSQYGALSKEFTYAHNQTQAGASPQKTLLQIAERNNSLLLERSMELLARGYSTGADMQHALKETADDIFTIFSIVRERAASLAIQKYTLLLGGGIIVPIILGTTFTLVSSLDYTALEMMTNTPAAEKTAFLETTKTATQAYLATFAALAAVFIAQQEGSAKRAIVYFLFLAPLALLLYNLALATNVLALT
ncbi:type II secretion system F family protein [Candidatus Micrarchaeota archaeon]|nr:type II secretion system F family protein [Candidatus Micrarchaeota archaeon]